MLCRSLRQAAASARQLCLAEQRILASVPNSIAQDLNTSAASSAPCWTSSGDALARPISACRLFSSAQGPANANEGTERETAEATDPPTEEQAEIPAEEQPVDPKDLLLAEKEQQVADYKDKLVRVLADMENLRERTNRQAEQSRSFAIQGFVKSLLDVADNLERAAGSVTDQSLQGLSSDGRPLTSEQSSKLLNGLLEGVHLTDRILVQALKQNGVEKFSPLGQKFDPNLHSALFQIPDAEKEAGTVVVVTKSGYLLNGRVVRAAEVGVSTAPQ